jgi:hypothetical protein
VRKADGRHRAPAREAACGRVPRIVPPFDLTLRMERKGRARLKFRNEAGPIAVEEVACGRLRVSWCC